MCFPVQKFKVEVFEQVYGVVDGVNTGVVRAEKIADPLGMFAVVAEAVVKGLVCAMAVGGAGNNGEADLCQSLQHFEEYLSDGFRSDAGDGRHGDDVLVVTCHRRDERAKNRVCNQGQKSGPFLHFPELGTFVLRIFLL